MNWKKLPLVIVAATFAAAPIILAAYRDPNDSASTAQVFAGFGMALIFGLGLGSLIHERVWQLGKTSLKDSEAQVTGIVVLAICAAVLAVMAIWVMPFFGLAVYTWLWASAYICLNHFVD